MDQFPDHFIAELPDMVHKASAVIVAGPDPAPVKIQGMPESVVIQMSHIEDHPQLVHGTQKFHPLFMKFAG